MQTIEKKAVSTELQTAQKFRLRLASKKLSAAARLSRCSRATSRKKSLKKDIRKNCRLRLADVETVWCTVEYSHFRRRVNVLRNGNQSSTEQTSSGQFP